MAAALEAIGAPRVPILSTDRGAPLLPPDLRGSISHKSDVAVALVQRVEGDWTVGVDIEQLEVSQTDISEQILTPRELAALRRASTERYGFELMARFSLKEAFYKALDPFVRRFVGFEEVEVDLHPDGTAGVQLLLKPEEGQFEADLRWHVLGAQILSTARVRPRLRTDQ
jgi:phosphopantetheine--protein transferase-like protein